MGPKKRARWLHLKFIANNFGELLEKKSFFTLNRFRNLNLVFGPVRGTTHLSTCYTLFGPLSTYPIEFWPGPQQIIHLNHEFHLKPGLPSLIHQFQIVHAPCPRIPMIAGVDLQADGQQEHVED
jgi:hypothetical protein